MVVDAALNDGVDRAALELAAQQARGPGARRVREAVELADGRAESAPETCARLALVELGLSVEPQVVIRQVGRVDLVVEGWLAIEIDGFTHHKDRPVYRRDRRRWSRLTALGYDVLVFSYQDVVHAPGAVHDLVLRTTSSRPRRACGDCAQRKDAQDRSPAPH